MFNLLRCLLVARGEKMGWFGETTKSCCWLCVFHLTEFMIFHRRSVLRRARANRSMTKCETQEKQKCWDILWGTHKTLWPVNSAFSSNLNRKKLSTWCSARCFVCYYTIFEFSQSFILPFHHHTRRWHLARILCAAFVWISFGYFIVHGSSRSIQQLKWECHAIHCV